MIDRWTRTIAAGIGAALYPDDAARTSAIVRGYWTRGPDCQESDSLAADAVLALLPDARFEADIPGLKMAAKVPFVYADPANARLKQFFDQFGFDSIVAGASDEYGAMLKLGEWLGSRWDHGTDPLGKATTTVDPVLAVERGARGARFWCEIAAKVAVQAFSAMGWPARLVTGSRTGRAWEHAVAEVWSNQFVQWIAIDTDFNVIFESEGRPLSAYELCHDAPAMQHQGTLRTRLLGRSKPSLPLIDLLPFYRSIYIDLRADWNSRPLRRCSPAGGDLSTWWTARPEFPGNLYPKIRVDDRHQFNWPVNVAAIRLIDAALVDGRVQLLGKVRAYSPYISGVQLAVNTEPWTEIKGGGFSVTLSPGHHSIAVRIQLSNGSFGPICTTQLYLPRNARLPAMDGSSSPLVVENAGTRAGCH